VTNAVTHADSHGRFTEGDGDADGVPPTGGDAVGDAVGVVPAAIMSTS
jgi:hypothetical protein